MTDPDVQVLVATATHSVTVGICTPGPPLIQAASDAAALAWSAVIASINHEGTTR